MKESTKCGIKNGETKLWKGKSIEPRNLKMDYSWKMSDAESISRSIMFNSVQAAHHANRNWNPAQTRRKKTNKEANREVDIIYAETHNLVLPVSTNKQNKQRSKRGETKDRNLTVHAILHWPCQNILVKMKVFTGKKHSKHIQHVSSPLFGYLKNTFFELMASSNLD